MKRKDMFMAYIKICMLPFGLFGIVNTISSNDFKNGEELSDNSVQIISDSLKIEQDSDSISVFATGSCVNTFENRIVSSMVSVQGCNTLTVQNVTITNNGDLTLFAPDAILINDPFEAQLGGVLNMKNELTQWSISYEYENAGNRIKRSANSMNLSDAD